MVAVCVHCSPSLAFSAQAGVLLHVAWSDGVQVALAAVAGDGSIERVKAFPYGAVLGLHAHDDGTLTMLVQDKVVLRLLHLFVCPCQCPLHS